MCQKNGRRLAVNAASSRVTTYLMSDIIAVNLGVELRRKATVSISTRTA